MGCNLIVNTIRKVGNYSQLGCITFNNTDDNYYTENSAYRYVMGCAESLMYLDNASWSVSNPIARNASCTPSVGRNTGETAYIRFICLTTLDFPEKYTADTSVYFGGDFTRIADAIRYKMNELAGDSDVSQWVVTNFNITLRSE